MSVIIILFKKRPQNIRMYTLTTCIFVRHGVMFFPMLVKPIKTLELDYTVIQLLIITIIIKLNFTELTVNSPEGILAGMFYYRL